MTILYFFISFISSVAGAISGIGGGIIIKPVLDAATSQSIVAISFLSGCTVLVMSFVSLIRSKMKGISIDIRCCTTLAVGGVIGGVLGKYLFNILKKSLEADAALGAIQAGILLAMTLGVLVYMSKKDKIQTKCIQSDSIRLLTGLLLGVVSAFLGIGGGPMNIAVLHYFFSMDAKKSAINSLYIIFFSQMASLITTAAQRNIPDVNHWILILLIKYNNNITNNKHKQQVQLIKK